MKPTSDSFKLVSGFVYKFPITRVETHRRHPRGRKVAKSVAERPLFRNLFTTSLQPALEKTRRCVKAYGMCAIGELPDDHVVLPIFLGSTRLRLVSSVHIEWSGTIVTRATTKQARLQRFEAVLVWKGPF